MNNDKSLTLHENTTLGIILSKEIEAASKLSIEAFYKGDREASALFEQRKNTLMLIRRKMGLH